MQLLTFLLAGLAATTVFVVLMFLLVKYVFGHTRKDESGFEVIGGNAGFRRGILRIAEFFAVVFIGISTIVGAVLRLLFFTLVPQQILNQLGISTVFFQSEPSTVTYLWSAFGAAIAFLIASLSMAPLFVLSLIERNTRRTSAFLERLATPRT